MDHIHSGNGSAMPPRTFGRRLEAAMSEAGINQPQLARLMGVTNQSVSKWVNDESIPKPERLAELARHLNTSVGYLLTGVAQPHIVQTGEVTAGSKSGGRFVPVFTPEQAIDVASRPDKVDRSLTTYPCGPDAFRIYIWDNSNASRFQVGDTVVIDPSVGVTPGDMVLVAIGNPPHPVFAKYRTNGGGVELVPLNPDWRPHNLVNETDGIIIGVMTEHAQPRRT